MALYLGSTQLTLPTGWQVWFGGVQYYPETSAGVTMVGASTNNGPINSASWSVAKPSGALAGDLLVLAVSVNSRPGLSPPTGFSTASLQTTTFDTQQLGVFYRLLDGSEGATFTGALDVSAYNNWVVQALLLRGVDPETPVADSSVVIDDSSHTGTFNIAAPSVTSDASGSTLIYVAATDINLANAGNTTYVAPAGFTSAGTLNSTRQVSSIMVATQTGAPAGASGTQTGSATVPAASAYMGALLSVSPPVAHPMTLSGTLPAAMVGVAYSASLALGGDYVAPVTVSAPGMPSWMSAAISGTNVSFTGTPTAIASAVAFTVTATDANAQQATSAQSVAVDAASASYAVLSATRKAANITLGSPPVTASTIDSSTVGTIDAAACVAAATANRYWEVAITAKAGASVTEAGIASSTLVNFGSNLGASGDVNSMGLASNGTFYREWGGTSTGATYATGDTLMFWLHNGSLYIGTVAGGWFGGAAGGVPTTAFATGITGNVGPAYSSIGSYGSNRAWAFNFGQAAWAGAPPSGATGWTM